MRAGAPSCGAQSRPPLTLRARQTQRSSQRARTAPRAAQLGGAAGATTTELDGLVPFRPAAQGPCDPVTAPPGARPIVLLPGFGNCTADYEAWGGPEEALAPQLRARGWHVTTLPLERKEWLQVARGLLTLGLWRGSLTTHPGYTWYLEKVAAAVADARAAAGTEQVHLLGHSAGGWLARAFAGGARGSGHEAAGGGAGGEGAGGAPHPAVASIVTLGAPHRPPRAWAGAAGKGGGGAAGSASASASASGSSLSSSDEAYYESGGGRVSRREARDMTGGALGWVDHLWPGAAFVGQSVGYVAVAGRSVAGSAAAAGAARGGKGPRALGAYAHDAYSQVCGEGDGVWGDCVVPLDCALLPGATNVVLDGVRHSMARMGSFDDRPDDAHVWYGSPQALDLWLGHLAALDVGRPGRVAGARAAAAQAR